MIISKEIVKVKNHFNAKSLYNKEKRPNPENLMGKWVLFQNYHYTAFLENYTHKTMKNNVEKRVYYFVITFVLTGNVAS